MRQKYPLDYVEYLKYLSEELNSSSISEAIDPLWLLNLKQNTKWKMENPSIKQKIVIEDVPPLRMGNFRTSIYACPYCEEHNLLLGECTKGEGMVKAFPNSGMAGQDGMAKLLTSCQEPIEFYFRQVLACNSCQIIMLAVPGIGMQGPYATTQLCNNRACEPGQYVDWLMCLNKFLTDRSNGCDYQEDYCEYLQDHAIQMDSLENTPPSKRFVEALYRSTSWNGLVLSDEHRARLKRKLLPYPIAKMGAFMPSGYTCLYCGDRLVKTTFEKIENTPGIMCENINDDSAVGIARVFGCNNCHSFFAAPVGHRLTDNLIMTTGQLDDRLYFQWALFFSFLGTYNL